MCKGEKIRRGNWGEKVAEHYLTSHGYQIIARQVEYRCGELDLIAAKEGFLFFIEVKTRASDRFGGVESVGRQKRQRLERARKLFCVKRGVGDVASQFDCILVLGKPGDKAVKIRHYRNCF